MVTRTKDQADHMYHQRDGIVNYVQLVSPEVKHVPTTLRRRFNKTSLCFPVSPSKLLTKRCF
jgi:hypothetical protein